MIRNIIARGIKTIPTLPYFDSQLGNAGEIMEAGSLHQFLCNKTDQFGPIFLFKFGPTDVVSVCDIQMWKDIGNLVDRPIVLFERFKPLIGEQSIQFQNTPEYQRRKKAYITPAFSVRSIKNLHYQSIEDNIINWLYPRLDKGNLINLKDLFEQLVIKILVNGAFGQATNDQMLKIRSSYAKVIQYTEGAMRGMPGDEGLFNEGRDEYDQIVQDLIINYKDNGEKPLLGYLLQESDKDLIRDETLTFFIGGYHNTFNWIVWVLYYLAKYPQEQAKIIKDLNKLPEYEVFPFEMINKIESMKNALDESARITALVAYAARINYQADNQLQSGHIIPQNTPILIAQGALYQSANHWENPQQFIPDRFANGQNRGLKFSPFGFAGGRICPGINLSQYQIQAILGSILKKYTVELDENHPEPGYDYGLITAPTININVRFIKRN